MCAVTPGRSAGSFRRSARSFLEASGVNEARRAEGSVSGTFGSLRGGRSNPALDSAIYEASEVHDSAEDLRQIIEEQDREADRLENVRACCDGKHCLTRLDSFKY